MRLFHLVDLMLRRRVEADSLMQSESNKQTNFESRIGCLNTRHPSPTDELNPEIGRINFHLSPSRKSMEIDGH